jgi:glyoxylase-like metal-dependent hydrolase (beta-lactamase superfamily II)
MQKVTIGNVEITPLQDASILMNPRMFIPEHGDEFATEYAHMADERGLMPMSVTCYLLRSAGKNVLIDTGLGPRKRQGFPGGKLDEAIKNVGLTPADIDVVIHTHLHIDHTGWNTFDAADGSRKIFFPKARFLVQQVEWDYWLQPKFIDNPAYPHLAETVEPLTNSGQLDFMKGEQAIDENLVFVHSPGHTPGHVCIGIQSAGEKAVIIGDASHHPAQLDHPDWSPSFDADPMVSAKTRDRLFNWAADEGRTWIAGHWIYPGMGRIQRVNNRRVFQAL